MNRQIRKTRAAIQGAFLDLMKHKTLEKITVTEIIERADIGRSTFYLHYQDIYDLYEKTEDELFEGLLSALAKTYRSEGLTDLPGFAKLMIDYIDDHREAFLIFMKSKAGGSNLNKVRSFYQSKLLCKLQLSQQQRADIMFIVSGITGVIEEWLQGHIELSRSELSALLRETLIRLT